MIRNNFFTIVLSLSALVLMNSCKCNDKEKNCPICPTNEVCEEGVCVCPSGHDYRYGVCVGLAGSSYNDTTVNYGNRYIAIEGCFTFDSTVIWLSSLLFDRLTDTTTPTVFPEELVQIFKYYDLPQAAAEHGLFEDGNARTWHDAEGRHISFWFGGWRRSGYFNNYAWYTNTFWSIPKYSDMEVKDMTTNFEGRFSRDYDTLYMDVQLRWDSDGNEYYETVLDSCQMVYHRLR